MAIDSTTPGTVKSAIVPPTARPAESDAKGLANNFQTFLTLLTTQLRNQSPLDPLDTNQFTQQLVQFAQIEQQIKGNEQLKALVDAGKAAQTTQALAFVGANVTVDGSTTALAEIPGTGASSATWNLTTETDVPATINVTNSIGQTVFSGNFNLKAGNNRFVWDGKGNDGVQWPPGDYKMTATAKNALGQDVAIPTETVGIVDSIDMTATPPLLSIGSHTFTADRIKRVLPLSAPTPAPAPPPSGGTGANSEGASGSGTGGTSS